MPRIKRLPLELTAGVNLVTDPKREAELAAEVGRRFRYIRESYLIVRATFGKGNSINLALAALRSEVDCGEETIELPKQADIQFAVETLSREAATARGHHGPLALEDIVAGKRETVGRVKLVAQRPSDRMLRLHVEALVAVTQNAVGKPIRVTKVKNYVYEPQALDRLSRFVVDFFPSIDPTIQPGKIINLILAAQKKYAGKSMRFEAILPGYGLKATPF